MVTFSLRSRIRQNFKRVSLHYFSFIIQFSNIISMDELHTYHELTMCVHICIYSLKDQKVSSNMLMKKPDHLLYLLRSGRGGRPKIP